MYFIFPKDVNPVYVKNSYKPQGKTVEKCLKEQNKRKYTNS